jgi:gliding motility-associated-like protein
VTGTTYLVAGLKPDQSVTIRVRAKGQLDCQLSDATSLTAKSDNPLGNTIFVPNTFTPNNDGKNDILYVYGNTIAKMKLRVYNQWGQFIYESLNIQNGWDGTYKGDIQPNGVYVYFLEAEFNDGTKTTKKGTITLLR